MPRYSTVLVLAVSESPITVFIQFQVSAFLIQSSLQPQSCTFLQSAVTLLEMWMNTNDIHASIVIILFCRQKCTFFVFPLARDERKRWWKKSWKKKRNHHHPSFWFKCIRTIPRRPSSSCASPSWKLWSWVPFFSQPYYPLVFAFSASAKKQNRRNKWNIDDVKTIVTAFECALWSIFFFFAVPKMNISTQ